MLFKNNHIHSFYSIIGHPDQFIQLCKAEKTVKDDGLIHRFLMCAPMPVFLTAEEMKNADPLPCSLTCILYYIQKMHSSPKIYKLSAQADITFDKYFNSNRSLVKKSNNVHKDIFLG